MRQSSSIGFRASIRARRVHFETWGVAAFLALPTGSLETGSTLAVLHSNLSSFTPTAGMGPDSIIRSTARGSADSLAAKPDSSLPGLFSDEYWRALADLDLAASRIAARGEPEIAFAEAVAFLAAGDYERAASAFRAMSVQTTNPPVAAASQAMLATTLMHEHKWEMLRDLSDTLRLGPADKRNIAELELWGRAFAGLDPQAIAFPAEPVELRLGISAVGTPSIRVRINGREYEFWLDTGATFTVLSSSVAADAGITALGRETLRVGTFAASVVVKPAVLKRMEIGPIVITNTPAMIMDASQMRVKGSAGEVPWAARQIDGIIGWDVIRQLAITMDFARGTVMISQPGNLGTIGTSAQNLTWVGKPFVQVRTSLGETVQFTLDTGAQSSFVNDAIVRKLRVGTTSLDARVFGIAANLGLLVRLVPALRLEVDGKSLLMRDLIVYTRPSSSLIESDGILGSNVGRFGTITIDATNGLFSIGAWSS
jgi:predicted aspartyl protease